MKSRPADAPADQVSDRGRAPSDLGGLKASGGKVWIPPDTVRSFAANPGGTHVAINTGDGLQLWRYGTDYETSPYFPPSNALNSRPTSRAPTSRRSVARHRHGSPRPGRPRRRLTETVGRLEHEPVRARLALRVSVGAGTPEAFAWARSGAQLPGCCRAVSPGAPVLSTSDGARPVTCTVTMKMAVITGGIPADRGHRLPATVRLAAARRAARRSGADLGRRRRARLDSDPARPRAPARQSGGPDQFAACRAEDAGGLKRPLSRS